MSRLQPGSKALPTSNISSQSASMTPGISTRTADPALTSSPKEQTPRSTTPVFRHGNRGASDPLSDRSTLFLIRRALCSHLGDKARSTPAPIDEILPPLTSSNEVDLQLYAFIAIIIREFVQTWYTKITPDPVFVEEVVKIIAHCTRALEQRMRNVDMESLLFDELPDLLDVHLQAYRTAHYSPHPPPLTESPRKIYHALWPLPALSPVPDDNGGPHTQQQLNNEVVYRQLLVQGVLAILLPTEDLENDCLVTLVGQIFSEMILGGGIGGKASEPWMLWEGITKAANIIRTQLPGSKANVRLVRSNSGSLGTPPLDVTLVDQEKLGVRWRIRSTFWLVLQYTFVAFTTIRLFVTTIVTAPSLPSRTAPTKNATELGTSKEPLLRPEIEPTPLLEGEGQTNKAPIVRMKVWSAICHLLDLDCRMPWLRGAVSMIQWCAMLGPGEVGKTDGMLDRILSHAIHTHVLDSSRLPSLLRAARGALFPNNTLASPRLIPSASEQLRIRRTCAETILSLIPARVQAIYLGGADVERRIQEVEEILNIFDDVYCNKHLLYAIVELIIMRLMPEMADKGIEELLEERLN